MEAERCADGASAIEGGALGPLGRAGHGGGPGHD